VAYVYKYTAYSLSLGTSKNNFLQTEKQRDKEKRDKEFHDEHYTHS